MRFSFFSRLAWQGIRKNRRLYLPFLITGSCMVMMHYVLGYLGSPACTELLPKGKSTLPVLMEYGSWILLLFSLIFLFYTNSFLVRRRQTEFGLYNVLGMDRWNLTRIITWESGITAAISIGFGILLGILFSKFAELGLIRMLGGKAGYQLMIVPKALFHTLLSFGIIYGILWAFSVLRIRFFSPVRLLKSEAVGEKPPKANWILGLAGFAVLSSGYIIAVQVENPMKAMGLFFVAVILVIIGTFLLMVSGSVLLCRLLAKRKSFYYNPRHFVPVSSMAYRMKRNGAGLASICIIATMVLVTISSTSCLWIGSDAIINRRCPRDFQIEAIQYSLNTDWTQNSDQIRDRILDAVADRGVKPENLLIQRYIACNIREEGERMYCVPLSSSSYGPAETRIVYFMSAEDFRVMTGKTLNPGPGECCLFTAKTPYSCQELTVYVEDRPHHLQVRSNQQEKVMEASAFEPVWLEDLMVIVISDYADCFTEADYAAEAAYETLLRGDFRIAFDLKPALSLKKAERLGDRFYSIIDIEMQNMEAFGVSVTNKAELWDELLGVYGGLFFLGILLSLIFLICAILILYYKQLFEGYEDRKRFEIMRKVGMTSQEIRRGINSQMLMVFFFPLLLAGLHLVFAFQMIQQILKLFYLNDTGLFIRTALISFLAFALVYALAYKLTSNSYYHIVSETRR